MLRSRLLHPEISRVLGGAGHGSKVLIADGNYPFGTGAHPAAARVYLNLAPGLVNATDVLAVLAEAIPIEAAEVMVPPAGGEPPIFGEFRRILGPEQPLRPLGRAEFYAAARGADTALVVATGERRIYANVLLTIGVVMP
ncbi:MAG TPA: RbsD/FucU family protein [Anaeromyxobacteraceae bacterium]|nr:RbsD/FucU family protein [Anaeromyxobacteraceae bacterium]